MPNAKDYYQTLGVKRGAGEDDIRKAYRRLARKFHPDLNPGDKAAEERFKQLQEAYDILSDTKKRKMYDQYGFYTEGGFPGGGQQGQPFPGGFNFGGFDFGEAFAAGAGARGAAGGFEGGGFSDLFSQFFGRKGGHEQARRAPGSELEYALAIDFWQSIRGAQVRLNINHLETCPACHGAGGASAGVSACPQCNGTGQVTQMAGAMRFGLACPRCDGTGRLKNACGTCGGEGRRAGVETVEVRIPPGAADGARLRVAGKGNAGTLGAPAGDLYITIKVTPHPFFRREGDDIHITIPVTVSEAGLGARIEVPTVDGRSLLKIPQGTQTGQKFRLREKGVQNSRKGARGDQIVEIAIQAPDVRDERTRDLLRRLAELDPRDPRAEILSQNP
jgi:molecular chaperone DnaJ